MTNLVPSAVTTAADAARQIIEELPVSTGFTVAQVVQTVAVLNKNKVKANPEVVRRLVHRMVEEGTIKPSGKRGRKLRYIRV